MKNFDFEQLFDNITQSFGDRIYSTNAPRTSTGAKKRKRSRTCRIEELESREMLSVTPLEFDAIRSQYSDLNWGNFESYNIIEVSAYGDENDPKHHAFSEEGLLAAIAQAAQSAENDLIVVRTTASQNRIILDGDALTINHTLAAAGSTTIVSYGIAPLIIDGNNQSQILRTAAGTETVMAGLTLANGRVTGADGGGAIHNSGTLTITESTLTANEAAGTNSFGGGAIYNYGFATLNISNTTISNNTTGASGGGIHNLSNATLNLTNSIVTGNTSTGTAEGAGGGGIYNAQDGILTVLNSTISSNFARSNSGGGIYGAVTLTNSTVSKNTAERHGGGIYSTDTVTLIGSTVSENSAGVYAIYVYRGDGSGIFGTGTITLTDSTVSDNTGYYANNAIYSTGTLTLTNSAVSGDSIFNRRIVGISTTGTVTLENSTVSRNNNDGINGTAASTITVTNSTIFGNTRSGITSAGEITVMSSTISGNGSLDGGTISSGGIVTTNTATSGELTVTNSVISGNYGCGIRTTSGATSGMVTITNSTIAGNFGTTNGRGIYVNGSSLELYNTIVAHNNNGTTANAATSSDIHLQSGGVNGNNNLVGYLSNAPAFTPGVVDGQNDNIVGTDAERADARFMGFQPYTAWTEALWYSWNLRPIGDGANSSPAIDAGDNSFADGLTFDLDGKERISGNSIDMGAYEFGGTIQPPTTPTDLRWTDRVITDTPLNINFQQSVTLTWNTDNHAANTRYEVQWRLWGGTWESLATPVFSNTATVTGLAHSSLYEFRVRAVGSNAVQSGYTDPLEVRTLTRLAAPASIAAESQSGTSLLVNWGQSADASGYRIQYSQNSNFTGASTLDVIGGINTSAEITGLTATTVYFVRVMALGTGDYFDSAYSSTTSRVTGEARLSQPVAAVSEGSNNTSLTVMWNRIAGAASYEIQFATDPEFTNAGTPVSVEQTSAGNVVVHELTGLVTGTEYYIRVVAVSTTAGTSSSLPSVAVTGTPAGASVTTPLDAPVLNETVVVVDATTLRVTWNNIANASSYTIGYAPSTDPANITPITNIPAGTTSWDITGLTTGVTYSIGIVAVGDGINYTDSPQSNIVSGTPIGGVDPPDPGQLTTPTGVTATDVGVTSVSLTWNAVTNAAGYRVEWSTSQTFAQIDGTQNAPQASATIDGLTTGTTYYFRVIAVGDENWTDSNPSATVSATPFEDTPDPNQLPAPTLNTPTTVDVNTVFLTWNRIDNASGYRLEYSTNSTFAAGDVLTMSVAQTAGGTVDVTVRGLERGVTYYYRVIALGSETSEFNDSRPSNVISFATGAPDPMGIGKVKSTSKTSTISSVTLTWTGNARNELFSIVCTTPGVTFNPSTQVQYIYTGNMITGAVISGLEAGKRYRFDVVAMNSQGKSTYQHGSKTVSTKVSVSTKTTKYAAPKGIKADKTRTTLSSVAVSWNPSNSVLPSGSSESYLVEVWSANRKTQVYASDSSNIVFTSATSATITNLAAGTKYTVKVWAVASDGTVSLEGRARVSTAKYAAVKGLCAAPGVNPNSASLTWYPSQFGETNDYEVFRLDGRDEIPVEYTLRIETGIVRADIVGLQEGVRHKFGVRAVMKDETGLVLNRSAIASVSIRLG